MNLLEPNENLVDDDLSLEMPLEMTSDADILRAARMKQGSQNMNQTNNSSTEEDKNKSWFTSFIICEGNLRLE